MESLFDDRIGRRIIEGLSALGRLIIFDRRGIGLSDPPRDSHRPVTTQWLEDLEAIVDTAEVRHAALVAGRSSAAMAILYGSAHPDRVSAIILIEPSTPRIDEDFLRQQFEGEIDSVELWCPSRANEPGFRQWFLDSGRQGASPGRAQRAYAGMNDAEGSEIERAARDLRVPTLVLRRPAHRLSPPAGADPLVSLIPGSIRVEVPGEDLMIIGGEIDAALSEITKFVTGSEMTLEPERVLAAVMFSDIVSSTETTSRLGDARYSRLLDQHDGIVVRCVIQRGGVVVKSTGDGVLATFPSAQGALLAARQMRTALLAIGLSVRTGIHVGDIERRGADVTGIGVVIAERIMEHAGGGELLVSETVTHAVAGSSHAFNDRGELSLKGVPGRWKVHAVD
jgi:class 3 adenylate cyclase/pimeloyl-ACP methyl ester carboxylesterase